MPTWIVHVRDLEQTPMGALLLAAGAAPDWAWQGGLPSRGPELPARNSQSGFRRNQALACPGLLI
jgi:hypothetical protein